MDNPAVRTEILGLQLALDGCRLVLSSDNSELITPVSLSADDAERLRLEMAKAQLWEWNQLEAAKQRAELRYRRYLGSWLVMCLAAFSAYLGYPSYYSASSSRRLSIFLWWRAGYEEQQGRPRRRNRRETNSSRTGDYLRDPAGRLMSDTE